MVMECGYDVIIVVLTALQAHRHYSGQMQVRPCGQRLSLLQVIVRDGILYFWLASNQEYNMRDTYAGSNAGRSLRHT